MSVLTWLAAAAVAAASLTGEQEPAKNSRITCVSGCTASACRDYKVEQLVSYTHAIVILPPKGR